MHHPRRVVALVCDVLFMAGMTITENSLIADIATDVPSSVRVFQRHGVDFCCGGKRPLGAACAELGLSVAEVAREIEDSATTVGDHQIDWSGVSLGELVQHIVATYHQRLREQLPELQSMANRVARVHGPKAPRLLDCLAAAADELAADLTTHMDKEEHVLFPAICRLEHDGACAVPLAQAIRVMESDHDRAGELLADLRAATTDFTPPLWACVTTRALYHLFEQIESDLHVHVHLENNVLFPRALKLGAAAGVASCG